MHRLTVLLSLALVASAIACSRDPEVLKRQYVESGDGYMRQGKFAEAIIEYANAVKRDSQFGEARFKLAEAHYAAGDTRAAFPEFVRAADLLKDDVEAQLRAGHLLLSGGLFEEARARARTALQKDPKNVVALVLMGNALAAMKNLQDAVSVLQRAIAVDPEKAGIHANLAILEMATGDQASAEEAFKKAVEVSKGSPDALLALGNFYRAVKRWEQAEETLKTAFAKAPRHVQVNQTLAALYIETGRVPEAEPYLKTVVDIVKDATPRLALSTYYASANRFEEGMAVLDALAKEPSHFVEAKLHQAMLHFARNHRQAAHGAIDEVLKREPRNAAALTTKARLLLAENRPNQAMDRVNEAIKANPNLPEAHLTLGRALVAMRLPEDARRSFNEVLRLDPQSLPARLELSALHLARNEVDTAIEFADQAVNLNAANLPARLALVRALVLRPEDRQRAEKEVRAVFASHPQVAAVHAAMGALFLAKEDSASARRSFEEALRLDATSREALTGLVAIDISQNRTDQARLRAEDLVARNPDDATPLLLAANVYGLTGDAERAEASLRRALTVEPSNPEISSLLGGLYIRQNRVKEAIKEFEEVVRLEPKSVGAATLLGLLQYSQGNTTGAQEWWQKALVVDPHAAAAANNLAWVYAEKGQNLEVALQLAQTARGRYPDAPEVLDTLGWVYYRKGVAVLAIEYFEQSIEKDPNNPLYHYHLGKAFADRGEDGKARRALERALALNPTFPEANDARKAIETLVF